MGVRFTRTDPEEVVARLDVAECHLQPFGLVHGGVHAGLVETVCSIGAALNAPNGHQVVGMENHISFLRPVRAGSLEAVGKPIQRGRRAQLWEASVFDGDGKLVASGRLRVLSLPPER